MSSDNGPDKGAGAPAERVDPTYEVEIDGEAKVIRLPLVIGVLADLSGCPAEELPPLRERKFTEIDPGTFDAQLAASGARVAFSVPDVVGGAGERSVDLTFESLDDFSPGAVAKALGLPDADPGKLEQQLDLIVTHEAFRSLESAWRGVRFLLDRVDVGEDLKVRVWNVSKTELAESFTPGEEDRSILFLKFFEETYGVFGGEPYGLLVADYRFDHSESDVKLLTSLGRVGAAALAPVLADAKASLLGLESWLQLPKLASVTAVLGDADHSAWNALRASDNACYLGLSAPAVLARLPDGSDPRLEHDSPAAKRCAWVGSAFAVAVIAARAFREHGWYARTLGVELGGALDGFPSKVMPTEVDVPERYESDLTASGILTLCHWKGKDRAIAFGSPSLHLPSREGSRELRAASLNYRLSCSRFVHHVKSFVRDNFWTFTSREHMEERLNEWISGYVEEDLDVILDGGTPARPLAAAKIDLAQSKAFEGAYQAMITIQPCYQFVDSSILLHLPTLLPRVRPGPVE